MVTNLTNLIVQVWMDPSPAEGESRWYDPASGWETNDRRKAIEWVQKNGVGLTHYWKLSCV